MTQRVWTVAIVSAVTLVYLFRLDRVAGLMIDDAWYLVLAKALASGEGYRLISSATVPIQPVVPPGFPALLAPVFAVAPGFPANLPLLKLISVAAMAGVGVATYFHLTAVRRVEQWRAAAVAVATVLTPALVFLATSTVMAEAVFTLAQLAAVILIDQGDEDQPSAWRRTALAGLVTAVAILIRSAGVALLAGGLLYLLVNRSWRRAGIFAGTAALCLLPWQLYSSAHAPNAAQADSHGGTIATAYLDLVAMRRAGDTAGGRAGLGEWPARVGRNLVTVFGRDLGGVLVPAFYRGPAESGQETVGLGGTGASMGAAPATVVVSFALSALLVLGLVGQVRTRASAADALVVVSMVMILMVPTRTFRYLLPLAPFLWLYFARGVQVVARAAVVRVALLLLIGLQVQEHLQYIVLKSATPPAAEWLSEARAVDDLLAWMDQHLPPGAPVAATNPGLVYLRTGRRAVVASDLAGKADEWRAAGIRFIVALQPIPLPPASLGFQPLYASRRLWIVSLTIPATGS